MKYLVILVKFPLLTWVAHEKDVCYGNISTTITIVEASVFCILVTVPFYCWLSKTGYTITYRAFTYPSNQMYVFGW